VAETALSGSLQRISNAIREVLSDCSVNFGQAENVGQSFSHISNGGGDTNKRRDSGVLNTAREEGSVAYSAARSLFSEANVLSFDSDVINEMWEEFSGQIMQAIRAFFESLSLQADLTVELEGFLQGVLFKVLVSGVRDLQAFDWKRWWDKRDLVIALMGRPILDGAVAEAEELMYAPIYVSGADVAEETTVNEEVGDGGAEGFVQQPMVGSLDGFMRTIASTASMVDFSVLHTVSSSEHAAKDLELGL